MKLLATMLLLLFCVLSFRETPGGEDMNSCLISLNENLNIQIPLKSRHCPKGTRVIIFNPTKPFYSISGCLMIMLPSWKTQMSLLMLKHVNPGPALQWEQKYFSRNLFQICVVHMCSCCIISYLLSTNQAVLA